MRNVIERRIPSTSTEFLPMATPPDTSLAPRPVGVTERSALMLLDEEQVAVKIDAEGFLTRIKQVIKLTYGTELYSAGKPGSETNQTKVEPFQPGFMKLVDAMGGTLNVPPAMRDPVTGAWRANPIIERYEDGVIKSIEATGVCAVRNSRTGEMTVSVQTIRFDAVHVLRQKLLNVSTERQDVVKLLSKDDIDEMRADPAKPLRGWSIYPLAPPFTYIVANNAKAEVRDAQRDHNNLVATATQRACSKAERLAAAHNPAVRKTWLYGALKYPKDAEGNATGPRYVEIPVVTWVEHRERGDMQAWLDKLTRNEDGTARVFVGETIIDDGEEEKGDVFDPDGRVETEDEEPAAAPAPMLEQRTVIPNEALPPVVAAPEKEKVLVEAPAPAVEAPPAQAAPAEPARPAMSPARQTLLERIGRLEALSVPPEEVTPIRKKAGIGDDLAAHDDQALRAYQRALGVAAAAYGSGS